jgi:ketosteroid isomerase-like protein
MLRLMNRIVTLILNTLRPLAGEQQECALDDRLAINIAKTDIRDGFNSGDVDRIMNAYSENLADMSGGMPSFYGPDARLVMRGRLQSLFATYEVQCAPAIIEILLFGAAAMDHGVQELTLTPRSGGPARVHRTRYVEFWRKEQDGIWRIQSFIDNAQQPPDFAERIVASMKSGAIDPVTFTQLPATELDGKP